MWNPNLRQIRPLAPNHTPWVIDDASVGGLLQIEQRGRGIVGQERLPVRAEDLVGLRQADFLQYVDFTGDRRLTSLGLPMLSAVKVNPFTWLDEVIFLRKEKNFFETRVTEYQTGGSVKNTSEEDLI